VLIIFARSSVCIPKSSSRNDVERLVDYNASYTSLFSPRALSRMSDQVSQKQLDPSLVTLFKCLIVSHKGTDQGIGLNFSNPDGTNTNKDIRPETRRALAMPLTDTVYLARILFYLEYLPSWQQLLVQFAHRTYPSYVLLHTVLS